MFFCIPAHGHHNPTFPVVKELVNRGNTVRFYSFNEFKEKVEVAKKYLDHDVVITPCEIQKTGPLANKLPNRVIAQKQEGLYAVYYHPICGNMSAAKWQELYEILKDMDEVEIRLTPQEDLYIVNLTMEEAKVVLEHTQDGAQTAFETSVSCIGAATCQVGLRDGRLPPAAALHRTICLPCGSACLICPASARSP